MAAPDEKARGAEGGESKRSRVVAFRVTTRQLHLIRAAAAGEGRTVSQFIAEIVLGALESLLNPG